jgi:[methyl-Co(III) methanol-specific corrinoid protein]:coenzyme M methyltransferase
MGNITLEGIKQCGNPRFADIHRDTDLMAKMAASSYKIFGYECAVLPYDLGVEAEALGSEINFYTHRDDIVYPTVKTKLVKSGEEVDIPENFEEKGRLPLIAEAIEKTKEDVGDEVPVGSFVNGPFTLAGQIMDLNDLLKVAFKKPEAITTITDRLVDVIAIITKVWEDAGVDYITVREEGAPADVISPRMFKSLVMENLTKSIDNINVPKILHICGDTNPIVDLMAQCHADAISVEKKCDLVQAREKIGPDVLLFGDIDPFGLLCNEKPPAVEKAVKEAIEKGVNAVMPGCDLWPDFPPENMRAMIEATKKYGAFT